MEPPIETLCGAEEGVGLGSLLRAVRRRVAAQHGRGGVAEEADHRAGTKAPPAAAEGRKQLWRIEGRKEERPLVGYVLFPLPWLPLGRGTKV